MITNTTTTMGTARISYSDCPYCPYGRLKESTTVYTSTGTISDCTNCGRTIRRYGYTTSTKTTPEETPFDKQAKKKESWFDRDRKEVI